MGLRSGKSFAVADALAKKGFAMDRAAELAISAALTSSDAGDAAAQCRSFEVVWLIYVGQSPGEEETAMFVAKRNASNMADGKDPKVDIRTFKSYYKQCSSTTVPTLEDALRDKTGRKWARYFPDTVRRLNEQYQHAAMRWINIVNYARDVAKGNLLVELAFLQHYFFVVHVGSGWGKERAVRATGSMSMKNAEGDK